jgi:hypothetical protein
MNKQPFVQGLLEAAMRQRCAAWAMQDQVAAAKADNDCRRLSGWLRRLESEQPAPLVEVGYHAWHGLVAEMPWLRRR